MQKKGKVETPKPYSHISDEKMLKFIKKAVKHMKPIFVRYDLTLFCCIEMMDNQTLY